MSKKYCVILQTEEEAPKIVYFGTDFKQVYQHMTTFLEKLKDYSYDSDRNSYKRLDLQYQSEYTTWQEFIDSFSQTLFNTGELVIDTFQWDDIHLDVEYFCVYTIEDDTVQTHTNEVSWSN